jgi:hypothetical protein
MNNLATIIDDALVVLIDRQSRECHVYGRKHHSRIAGEMFLDYIIRHAGAFNYTTRFRITMLRESNKERGTALHIRNSIILHEGLTDHRMWLMLKDCIRIEFITWNKIRITRNGVDIRHSSRCRDMQTK